MAETVTLAYVTIDESGAVKGYRTLADESEKSVRKVGEQANAFEHHLFSMRAAAAALLGGFSLAGLIIQVQSVATQAAEASENFGKVQQSVDEFRKAIYSSTGPMNDLIGLFDSLINRLKGIYDSFQTLKSLLQAGATFGQSIGAALPSLIFGASPPVEKSIPAVGAPGGFQAAGVTEFMKVLSGAVSEIQEWERSTHEI